MEGRLFIKTMIGEAQTYSQNLRTWNSIEASFRSTGRALTMKPHYRIVSILAIQFCLALGAFGQGSYKPEAIGAAPPEIPSAILSILDTHGVRVASDGGITLCEV